MIIHTETLPNGFSFQMHLIPGGAFNMGSTDADKAASETAKPQRIGVLVTPFFLAPYTVTQSLWKAVMGEENNPSRFLGDQNPVERVSWYNAQKFITALNHQTDENRQNLGLGTYRLPTEAEWEYAARGGQRTGGYRYAGSDKLKEVGWYKDNSDNKTHEVGLLLPNELGLYDMSGNVWEWVEDHWQDNYIGAPNDGRPWLADDPSARRVLRGGSFFDVPRACRSTHRDCTTPAYRGQQCGFRLALSPSSGEFTPAIL